MPLSEILKRKRQSEAAASGSGIAFRNEENMNQKQINEGLIRNSSDRVVSATSKEVKSTIVDDGTAEVAHGDVEHETEDGMIAADERMEVHELEGDDQRDGDYYYDQGEEWDYNYEEGENVDPGEEYIEEDGDGDDFEKKLGVMFS